MKYVPARIGTGLRFGQNEDFLEGLPISLGIERAISAWVWFDAPYRKDVASDYIVFIAANGDIPGSGMSINRYGVNGTFGTSGDTGSPWPRSYADGAQLARPGRWYHVAAVHSDLAVRLYVDGRLDSELLLDETSYLAPLSSMVGLGGIVAGSDGGLDGVLDEVTIWDRALSEAEVGEIYDRQSPPFEGEVQALACDGGPDASWAQMQVTVSPDAARVDSSGLVALWPLNGRPGSMTHGATPEDVSDNGISGSYRNLDGVGMTFEGGMVGESVRFDGKDDHVLIELPLAWPTGGEVSIAGWVRIVELTDGNQPVLHFGPLQVGITSTGSFEFATGTERLESIASAEDGAWHHVVGTFAEGDFVRLHVDGRVEMAVAQSGERAFGSDSNILLAADGGNFLAGNLDELSIWERALNPDEVRELYLAGAHRVRLQVRTCEEPTCDGRPFHGPDGTPESFFAPATYVFEPGPLAFPLSVMPGRYLQWRALLASELTTSGPVVASVAFLLE